MAERERLESARLLPPHGASVHVNRPCHRGDTPLHEHDFWEAALVVSGRAVHRTIRGDAPLRRGDVVVLRPGQWHAYLACRDLHLANLCLGPALLDGELAWALSDPALAAALAPADGQGVLRLRLAPAALRRCLGAIARLAAIQAGRDLALHRAEQVAQVLLILNELARVLPRQDGAGALPPPLATVQRAFAADPTRAWSLAGLARLAGCSTGHLLRLFRRRTGTNPTTWLARLRVERAAVLLLTTARPVAEVGAAVGWSDPNYFARRFRALLGVSPGAYRRHGARAGAATTAGDWVQW